MDLYELAKLLKVDIVIRYNPDTDEFAAELEDVCSTNTLTEAIGRGKCRKDALRELTDIIRGKELIGNPIDVKVPDDISIPSGL